MPRLCQAMFEWKMVLGRPLLRHGYGAVALAATATFGSGVAVYAQQQQRVPDVTVTAPDNPPASPLLPNSSSGNGPATVLGGTQQQQTSGDKGDKRCSDPAASKDTSLGCLNAKLRQKVDAVNPPILNTPPIDAKSSDLKVGTVNIPAVQQQYGQNFGRSVIPYRPTVVYPSALGRR